MNHSVYTEENKLFIGIRAYMRAKYIFKRKANNK